MSLIDKSGNKRLLDEDALRRIARSTRGWIANAERWMIAANDENLVPAIPDLPNVFHTCETATLAAAHRAAAWNALCSFIDAISGASTSSTRIMLWKDGLWNRALDVYLNQAHVSKPKISKQLQSTLVASLRKAQQSCTNSSILPSGVVVADRLLYSLTSFDDAAKARAGAQLLGVLLLKHTLTLDDLLKSTALTSATNSSTDKINFESLLYIIFRWLGRVDFGPTVAHLVVILLDEDEIVVQDGKAIPRWITPLSNALSSDQVNVDDLRVHVFPSLFKRKVGDLVAFVQSQNRSNESTSAEKSRTKALLFPALQSAKELGRLQETNAAEFTCVGNIVRVPYSYIVTLLSLKSHTARLTGMSLLIITHATTKPLSATAIKLIKSNIVHFFADTDADFRSSMFSIFRKLVDRVRAVTAASHRHHASKHKEGQDDYEDEVVHALQSHRKLLLWLYRFLLWELRPTASYQRHISALKCLQSLVQSGVDESVKQEFLSKSATGDTKWPFSISLLTQSLRQLLIQLLFDPFEDVRQTSASILIVECVSASHTERQHIKQQLRNVLDQARSIVQSSGRADHADGYAHLQAVYFRCLSDDADRQQYLADMLAMVGDALSWSRKSLREAVKHYPLHGHLLGLRYILQENPQMLISSMARTIFSDLQTIWDLVKQVLCNDAPEGYAPEELDEDAASIKESLSYCWRALKEASSLLNVMITLYPVDTEENISFLVAMSDLCFAQLAELRHRGAFSTVAQTWSACCSRCSSLPPSNRRDTLDSWYTEVIRMIHDRVTINTRRSAGVPSLLCGLLIGDRSGHLIGRAMQDLEIIARQSLEGSALDEASLPQVHAMNCIKDILRISQLREPSEGFLILAMQLAADALCSEAWAIRNCGLMLFRAIIDRLLGTNDAAFDSNVARLKKIDTKQMPELLGVVLRCLTLSIDDAGSSGRKQEAVFPALQLLQHLRAQQDETPRLMTAVRSLIASSSWHIRDKAAQTYAILLSSSHRPHDLLGELKRADALGHNRLHGVLLTARYMASQSPATLEYETGSKIPISDPALAPDIAVSHQLMVAEAMAVYKSHRTISGFVKAACIDVVREYVSVQSNVLSITEQLRTFATSLPDMTFASIVQAASVRQAWARLTATMLRLNGFATAAGSSRLLTWTCDLVAHDVDAVSYFVETLHESVEASPAHYDTITRVCHVLLIRDLPSAIKCQIVDILVTTRLEGLNESDLKLFSVLEQQDLDRHYADKKLILQSLLLDRVQAPGNVEAICEIRKWLNIIIMAGDAHSTVTPEAAAQSLSHVRNLWSVLNDGKDFGETYLRTCIVVYDLTNDDDEDIRLMAADTAQRILSSRARQEQADLDPLDAAGRLINFMVERWHASPLFFEIAMHRATNLVESPTNAPRHPSILEQLQYHAQPSKALFAEEKQNLYIDPGREVKIWTRATMDIMQRHSTQETSLPAQDFSSPLIALTKALPPALPALKTRSFTSAPETPQDIPPSSLPSTPQPLKPTTWFPNPDIFTIGLNILSAIEILLCAHEHHLFPSPSESNTQSNSEPGDECYPEALRQSLRELIQLWRGSSASDVPCTDESGATGADEPLRQAGHVDEEAGAADAECVGNVLWRWEATRILEGKTGAEDGMVV